MTLDASHRSRCARLLAGPMLGLAGLILTAGFLSACGKTEPPPPTPTPSETTAQLAPRLVLTPADITGIHRRVAAGDEPWASAWTVFRDGQVADAMAGSPHVAPGPYRGGGDVHDAFLPLDDDSRNARDLAIAWAASGDEAYARKARDYLVAWASRSRPTRLDDYDSPDTGQLQSWSAFSFAYAYDLTRATGVYSADDRAAVEDYFRTFSEALRGALDAIAESEDARSTARAPYEWDGGLTYQVKDRTVGGDFTMAIGAALIALGAMTGDDPTLSWVLGDQRNPLRVPEAVKHAFGPSNDGDNQGTRPAPEVLILKGNDPGRGGTVDYMTYNARLATLLCDLSGRLGRPLGGEYQDMLERSWLYLARFFGPGAQPSPNPGDSISSTANLPRFAPAYRAVHEQRLLDVLEIGDRASYYEPQFLGPVTLTHTPLD